MAVDLKHSSHTAVTCSVISICCELKCQQQHTSFKLFSCINSLTGVCSLLSFAFTVHIVIILFLFVTGVCDYYSAFSRQNKMVLS